jgi:hypothetical protein
VRLDDPADTLRRYTEHVGDLTDGMGLVKTTVLLGFTLAAYNVDRISNTTKAKHRLDDAGQVVERPRQQRARQ